MGRLTSAVAHFFRFWFQVSSAEKLDVEDWPIRRHLWRTNQEAVCADQKGGSPMITSRVLMAWHIRRQEFHVWKCANADIINIHTLTTINEFCCCMGSACSPQCVGLFYWHIEYKTQFAILMNFNSGLGEYVAELGVGRWPRLACTALCFSVQQGRGEQTQTATQSAKKIEHNVRNI